MYVLNNLEEEVHYKRPLTTDYCIQEEEENPNDTTKATNRGGTSERFMREIVCLSVYLNQSHALYRVNACEEDSAEPAQLRSLSCESVTL